MKAEVDYLAREKFTGEVSYWRDGTELRRKLTCVHTGSDAKAPSDAEDRAAEFHGSFDKWTQDPEHEMKMFFNHGYIKRIEW